MTLQQRLDPVAGVPSPASFHDLMAGLGYMLFQWSMVERSLDDEIATLRRDAGDVARLHLRPRSVNERLGEWRALLERGRRRDAAQGAAIDRLGERVQDFQRLRNLVANGLSSAEMEGAEPVIRCTLGASRHGAHDEVRLAMADMLAAIDAMEAARADMARLRDHGGH